MSGALLAAIVFDRVRGDDVDAVLARLIARLRHHDVPLAGAVQSARERDDRCTCDLVLTELGSGRQMVIFEDRGRMARGCRLDPAALDEVVGQVMASLDRGAQLLIVNRFGKQEVDGGGFRAAIAEAQSRGVATLVAVAAPHLPAWREFVGAGVRELDCDASAIQTWLCDAGLAVATASREATRQPIGLSA